MAWVVLLVLVALGARGEETTTGTSTPEEPGTTILAATEPAVREVSTPRSLSTTEGGHTRISSTVRPTEGSSRHTSFSTTESTQSEVSSRHTSLSTTESTHPEVSSRHTTLSRTESTHTEVSSRHTTLSRTESTHTEVSSRHTSLSRTESTHAEVPSTASPSDLRERLSSTPRPAEPSPDPPITSTALPDGPDSRTDAPVTELDTKSEAVVATSVRPVVAEPVRYATKPPRVVLATRPPYAALLKATTPPPAQPPAPQPAFFIPPKQQQPSGTPIQRKGGIKIKKPKKKDNGMSSLIYIPIMIQAQLIPMMLMNLKFLALKALTIGKLALLILGLNLLRNAMLGYDNDAEQYEHQNLASQHYGYNGGPEYGSWVNRRLHNPNDFNYRRNRFRQNNKSSLRDRSDTNMRESTNDSNSKYLVVSTRTDPATTVLNVFGNYPYRGYQNNILKEKKVVAEKAQ